jgi:phosphatidate cytidylyltransferase
LGGLLLYPVALIVIVAGFAAVGVWEVSRALLQRRIAVPLAPVLIGTVAMPPAAYFSGAEGLLFALVASAVAVLVWRCLDPAEGAVPSIFAGVFVLAWIPFMMSFVFLLLRAGGPTTGITWLSAPHVGALQVVIMLLLVVANDTFGYLVGATFGKHPMAPKISPKKSWEGFAGSVAGAVLVGVLATVFLLGQPWWLGLVLAVCLVPAGTAGDLAESMVKRELGVKDMSSILPGHGGVMDRLDSILFSAPVAFLIFTALAQIRT